MRKQVSVQVNAEHLGRIDAVSHDLQAAGMEITGELKLLGALRGLVDESKLDDLKKVAGVGEARFTGDEGSEEPRDYRIS